MTIGKKRKSSREPLTSPISDEERLALVRKAFVNILSEEEEELFASELRRATGKVMSAVAQLGGNLTEQIKQIDALARASSATASQVLMLPAIDRLIADGAKRRRDASKAGRVRHDQFAVESARRQGWERLRTRVLRNWPKDTPISDRELAKQIAEQDPDSPPMESVRSYLKARKKRVGQHQL